MTREEIEKKAEEHAKALYVEYIDDYYVHKGVPEDVNLKLTMVDSDYNSFIAGAKWMQEQNGWKTIEELPRNYIGHIIVRGTFDGYYLAQLYNVGDEYGDYEYSESAWECDAIREFGSGSIKEFKYID